jgi:hypothetical protein
MRTRGKTTLSFIRSIGSNQAFQREVPRMSEGTAVAEIAAFKAEYRRHQLSQFAPDALLWLAALPEWTDQLALAVRFPRAAGAKSISEVLDRMSAAGLLATREDIGRDGEVLTAFWLPASRRPEVGEHLRGIWEQAEMTWRLRDLADVLQQQPPEQTDALGPWLQLVKLSLGSPARNRGAADGDPTGTKLLEEVDRLLAASRATEALSMVGAAQALGDILGEPFTSSARRAQWRIDRSYRQALDARSLRYYQPRQEVERSIDELLRGTAAFWALHLLGDGGVGKTMVIRDLCSGRYFSRTNLEQWPVARIDFDYLDPRYPQARPGELLLALAGELTTYVTTREIERRFRRSDDTVATLHTAVASSAAPHLERQYLSEAIDAFASYLRGFERPVVLVLDTCEELAKLHPPGGRAPAVDRTFELLEQIHERAPQMRALLAGRRWLVPPPAGGSTGGLKLDPRPYLRVVLVGGFTDEQAQQYIDRRDTEGKLSAELRMALVSRSTRPDGVDVSPFDLVGYCEWALAEPGLDAEGLRNARGDPYVERRIIDRLPTSEVRDCLPVAVELGRFDRAMIEPVLRRRGIDLDKAFSGLVGQEWVSAVTFDADGRPKVIEVDAQLRPRLREIIAARPVQFPLDRTQLGRDLAHLVTSAPLEELAVEAIEAALHLLPAADAATMWDQLEQRLANTPGAWSWAGHATARAAAAEALRPGQDGVTILAAIRATQAAAVLRQPGRPGIHALWEEVERLSSRHPDPTARRRLQFRALCFLAEPGDPVRLHRLAGMWRDGRNELAVGSILAKFDVITGSDVPVWPELAKVLDELCQSTDPGIAASARLARAASRRARGDLGNATADVDSALQLVEAEPVSLSGWADWVPASRLRDRLRLARLVLAMQRSEPPEMFPLHSWHADALSYTDDIDAERLIAAIIMLELCWRPADPGTLASAAAADTYNPARQPTHTWHDATPTLCAAIAAALAARGDLQRASSLLRARREAALSLVEDPTTIGACEELLAKLSRAFRTTDLTTSIRRIAQDGSSAAREHAWAALALVDGKSPASLAEAGDARTWWRTQIIRPGFPFVSLPRDGTLTLTGPEALERTLIQDGRLLPQTWATASLIVAADLRIIRGESADLATALHIDALAGELGSLSYVLRTLPPRLVAETALAEAELVALRLPQVALRLLPTAFNCADTAGDPILVGRAAVLLVLVTARAGHDTQLIGTQYRDAIQAFSVGERDLSGWYARCETAKALLVGVTPSFPGATPLFLGTGSGVLETAPLKGTTYAYSTFTGSPELDPRPLHGEPKVIIGSALESSHIPLVLDQGDKAEGPLDDPPALSPLGTWWNPDAEIEPKAPSAYRLFESAFRDTHARTAAVTADNLPTRGGSSRGLAAAVLVTRLLVEPGRSIAHRWLGYRRRRRYNQRAIALDPEHGVDRPLPCRLTATAVDIRIEPVTSPGTRPRSRRQYLVIPLLGRENATERIEQSLTDQVSPLIGKRRPLFVRFRANTVPLAWRFWGGRLTGRGKVRAEYQGPPNLQPRDQRRRTEPTARWCTVQHLVGIPVDTPAGWRFRIAVSSSSSSESYVKSSRWTYRGEELLDPDKLRPGQTALVVLQAEPVDRLPEPLGAQYQGMCALAAELLSAGAGAVLIVPPLPEPVAVDVARRIWNVMTRHRYRTHPGHVLDLADQVRNIVASSENPSVAGNRASEDVLLLA